MRITVIGGTGHIGGYLVPRLVEAGHEVTVATRGRRPWPDGPAWERARTLALPKEDPAAALAETPADAVIDIVQKFGSGLYQALRGRCRHFIWCGSLWMWGPPAAVPTPELRAGTPLTDSYVPRMDELCRLREQCRADGVAFTAVMPPNLCGPGKVPLELAGGRDPAVHRAYARGEPVRLPHGCNTLIGPCDVQDVAECFALAAEKPDATDGEFLNVGADYALPAPRWADVFADIHGRPVPVEWIGRERFEREVATDAMARLHFDHHMCPDIRKARRLLGYAPRYTPEQSMARAVEWMRAEGLMRPET
jgi:nucleoside-diphosphate-sugar epimerase